MPIASATRPVRLPRRRVELVDHLDFAAAFSSSASVARTWSSGCCGCTHIVQHLPLSGRAQRLPERLPPRPGGRPPPAAAVTGAALRAVAALTLRSAAGAIATLALTLRPCRVAMRLRIHLGLALRASATIARCTVAAQAGATRLATEAAVRAPAARPSPPPLRAPNGLPPAGRRLPAAAPALPRGAPGRLPPSRLSPANQVRTDGSSWPGATRRPLPPGLPLLRHVPAGPRCR